MQRVYNDMKKIKNRVQGTKNPLVCLGARHYEMVQKMGGVNNKLELSSDAIKYVIIQDNGNPYAQRKVICKKDGDLLYKHDNPH